MDVSLFISIFVGGGLITMLLTQSIKQFYYNKNSQASPNLIALVNAIVVGGGGTAFAYMLLGIAWSVNNILCLFAMMLLTWMGSMIGYSKILETIKQFKVWQDNINNPQVTQEILEQMQEENQN